MNLQQALDVQAGELVAFVGAGGKTTAAWRLQRELSRSGHPVVFTTTTHIMEPADLPLLLAPRPEVAFVAAHLVGKRVLALAAGREAEEYPQAASRSFAPVRATKLVGLDPERLGELARRLPAVTWLVEADGARGLLLKAPAAHEPVIPRLAARVVVVGSVDAVGKALDEQSVFRAALASELLCHPLGSALRPEAVAALLTHPQGGLQGVPHSAAVVLLLTQRGPESPHPAAPAVAEQAFKERRVSRVMLASLRADQPVLEVWTA